MKAEKATRAEELEQRRIKKELEIKEKEERKRQREDERKEKKEQAEREKEAKRIKLEAEKQAREEKKLREQREKDEQRQKREEEKRQRDQKKEEERLKKEEEKQRKEEERQKKEEEKQKKEDERQKKLDEKRLHEEMKLKKELEEKEKKEKQQNLLRNFFKQNSKSPGGSSLNNSFQETNTLFKPFQLQPNQSLASLVPAHIKQRFDSNILDELFSSQCTDKHDLYLDRLRNGYESHKLNSKCKEADVIMEDDTSEKNYKAKLFQFHENNRPPYFGTWRKKSSKVSGRKPFAKDKVFDYEVDSDDEWEEEEKGESLKDNDSEISEEEGDGYELDDMFVSHGYLSDDELKENEGAEDTSAIERGGILMKEEALLDEKKRPVKKLQPLVIGCLWKDSASDNNNLKLLEQFSATYLTL